MKRAKPFPMSRAAAQLVARLDDAAQTVGRELALPGSTVVADANAEHRAALDALSAYIRNLQAREKRAKKGW